MKEYYQRIYEDPQFQHLNTKRKHFSSLLTVIMLVLYFSFILVVAFKPEFFAIPLSPTSVITIGIPIGVMLIFISFLLTGIYVYRLNSKFDPINNKILEEHLND